MNKNWKATSLNAVGFGLLGAALFDTIFVLLGLSQNTVDNLVLGMFVGALSGMLIAVVVSVVGQELMAQKNNGSLLGWYISNAFIGAFTGATVTTYGIIVVVSLIDFPVYASNLIFWGEFIGRLFGTAFGMVTGLTIGAGWNRLQLKTAD